MLPISELYYVPLSPQKTEVDISPKIDEIKQQYKQMPEIRDKIDIYKQNTYVLADKLSRGISNLKERDSETYKKAFDIFRLNEQEKVGYDEIYARTIEVPLGTLSYDKSVWGDANMITKEIRVGKELHQFQKNMVKKHERNHIKHPGLNELQIRILTADELEMEGKYIEAEIAKRFVLMMAGQYRYN